MRPSVPSSTVRQVPRSRSADLPAAEPGLPPPSPRPRSPPSILELWRLGCPVSTFCEAPQLQDRRGFGTARAGVPRSACCCANRHPSGETDVPRGGIGGDLGRKGPLWGPFGAKISRSREPGPLDNPTHRPRSLGQRSPAAQAARDLALRCPANHANRACKGRELQDRAGPSGALLPPRPDRVDHELAVPGVRFAAVNLMIDALMGARGGRALWQVIKEFVSSSAPGTAANSLITWAWGAVPRLGPVGGRVCGGLWAGCRVQGWWAALWGWNRRRVGGVVAGLTTEHRGASRRAASARPGNDPGRLVVEHGSDDVKPPRRAPPGGRARE